MYLVAKTDGSSSGRGLDCNTSSKARRASDSCAAITVTVVVKLMQV